jgi:hypothetical protein
MATTAGKKQEAGNKKSNDAVKGSAVHDAAFANAEKPDDLPEGFFPINTGGGKQNWVKPAEGLIIVGELVGRFGRRQGSQGHFYQIRLENTAEAVTRDDDGNTVTVRCGPGDIINIDEKTSMTDLAQYAASSKKYRVYIKYVRKEDMANGQSFWRIKIGGKEIADGGMRQPAPF